MVTYQHIATLIMHFVIQPVIKQESVKYLSLLDLCWLSLVDVQILEMGGMATPEEVPQILQIVDDYLRDCSSQTNTCGSPPTKGLNFLGNQLEKTVNCEQVKRPDSCCTIWILIYCT